MWAPQGCFLIVSSAEGISRDPEQHVSHFTWHQYLSPGLEKRLLMPRLSPATAHSKVPAAKGSWLKLTVLKIRSLGNVATVARIIAGSSESLRLDTRKPPRSPHAWHASHDVRESKHSAVSLARAFLVLCCVFLFCGLFFCFVCVGVLVCFFVCLVFCCCFLFVWFESLRVRNHR